MVELNRRNLLGGLSAMGFASAMGCMSAAVPAHASTTSGYKALVCLYLDGGMDSADTVLPKDTESADALQAFRPEIISSYHARGISRNPDNLIELKSARNFGGRRFGLPRELSGLADLYERRRMAIVGNVGPLVEPVDRYSMESGTAFLPKQLYSHNDQRSTWLTGGLEGLRPGWGGNFAKHMADASNNDGFGAVTVGGETGFLRTADMFPFSASANGRPEIAVIDRPHSLGAGTGGNDARRILEAHIASRGRTSSNPILQDIISSNALTRDLASRYSDAVENGPALLVEFPGTRIGRQLEAIARTIAAQNSLSASRQVFYARQTGYDTHQDQTGTLPGLQGDLDAAIIAFDAAMEQFGMQESVTLFTASDFGRTVVANGNGTDHGWGGHHFIVGGAVKGGEIYGDIPPFDLSDQRYTQTRGRLIPTTSVVQMAASLGHWFGLDEPTLRHVLPNLQNFDRAPDFFGLGSAI